MTIHENTLKWAPWSISKAGVARQCPQKFRFQYVEKPKVEKGRQKEALIGKAVHQILEFALSGRPIKKSHEITLEQFELTSVEQEEVQAFMPNVEHFIGAFKKYQERHNGTDLNIEHKLSVDIDGNPCKYFDDKVFLRGVIDLSMRFGRKPKAVILDHKTGKQHDISYFGDQFLAYALLLKSVCPDLQKIKTGINFVKTGDIVFKDGMEDVAEVPVILGRVIQTINKATENMGDLSVARPGPLCPWCDYKSICDTYTGS